MVGHAASRSSLSFEEKMGLLEERSLSSDADSDNGAFEMELRQKVPEWFTIAMAPVIYVRTLHWRSCLVRFLIFLIPSFLQGRHMREQIRPAKLGPTAYLDGMRGLAALFVYFCHYSYQAFTIAEGYGCGENNYHFLKLPIIRLFYQGPAAVCVFFIISGYALSYRPLKFIRKGSTVDMSTTMSSLVFRRYIRLYLPTAASTLLIVCLMQTGIYELTRPFAINGIYHKNIMEPHPFPLDTWSEQLTDWFWCMVRFVNVWNWEGGGTPHYDVHLWTIPIEYRCSLFLFLTVIGTARLQTKYRFMTVIGVMWFAYRSSKWDFVLFLWGMLLAEMDHIRGAHVPAPAIPLDEKQTEPSKSFWKSFYWGTLSIVGLYLLSQPDGRSEITPGWVYLSSLVPKWWAAEPFRIWQCTGAAIFVLAVGRCDTWQRFFNTAVVQYFGKISYAIYLMHGPAMHAVGYHWERWAYGMTGLTGYWYNAGFFLGASLCIPTVIWWADVFWRAVDIPSVKFAKWFENRCVKKD